MGCMESAASALHFFQDVGGGGGPDKGLGMGVVGGAMSLDGGNEFGDAMKDSSAQAAFGQIAEEALHHVEPGSAGGREVKMEAWIARLPGFDLLVFVRGIIVADEMILFVSGCSPAPPDLSSAALPGAEACSCRGQ